MRFDESTLYNIYSKLNGKRYPLYDLALWKNGLAFKKIDFSDAGVPVIKIAELNNGIGGNTSYTKQIFSDDVHLKKEDLLFSWSGNPQTSIDIFKFQLQEGWLNQHIFKVTPNEEIVDRDYFYFLMKYLKPWFTQIASNKQTTGLGHVTIADIKRMSVLVPSLTMQKKIVDVLKPINDKIQINASINKNLEQQAQVIFKAWFVDFEPFNEEMPSDWIIGTVDDLGTENICGKTPPTKKKEYYGGNTPFITIPDMHGCVYNVSTERYLSAAGVALQPKKTLPPNTVCVSCIGTAGLVNLVSEKSQSNQQINSIVPKEGISAYYIYLLMQTLSETINKLGQSGSTIVNLNKTQFSKIQVAIPSEQVLCNFDTLCKPLFEMILSNQKENIELANLRDALLPKLMSSELDVSDIDL